MLLSLLPKYDFSTLPFTLIPSVPSSPGPLNGHLKLRSCLAGLP